MRGAGTSGRRARPRGLDRPSLGRAASGGVRGAPGLPHPGAPASPRRGRRGHRGPNRRGLGTGGPGELEPAPAGSGRAPSPAALELGGHPITLDPRPRWAERRRLVASGRGAGAGACVGGGAHVTKVTPITLRRWLGAGRWAGGECGDGFLQPAPLKLMSTSWTQPLAQVALTSVLVRGRDSRLCRKAAVSCAVAGQWQREGLPLEKGGGEALLLSSRMSPSGASVMTALQGCPPEPGPRRATCQAWP